MVEKNKIYECEVTDLTVNGDGVAKIDGYPLFVKDAVPGDFISVKVTKTNKSYGFGTINNLITPSPDRRTVKCPSFSLCGGCSLMHMGYDAQLRFKENFVLSNLTRIGGYDKSEFEFETIIGADNEFYYRNKAQFPVGLKGKKAVCGFFAPKSHEIIPCTDCHIQNKIINSAVECVVNHINKHRISVYNEKKHNGLIRHIYVRYGEENGELMVCIVTNGNGKISAVNELVESLKPLGLKSLVQNINTKKTNVILGERNVVLYGKDCINIRIDDLTFKVNPHSFFQVNTEQMKKLYAKALEYADVSENDTVFDLYCGVGSISLYLAKCAKKVIGVEIVPQAIENAKENAKLSNISNAEFYCGDCTEVVDTLLKKGERADVVVVDPPRKGCDEKLFELIEKISPRKLVYVSCNSATLARDVAILRDRGYVMKKCTPVDLFPQTGHVETVALLSKLKESDSITVELNLDELEVTAPEMKATYSQIKEYVLNKYGFKVSSLNIAQIKKQCGIIERENYNKPSDDYRQPNCPKHKSDAIKDAFEYFKMI